ncbi:MAG: DUF6077 domain-containing protein [Myxococcota bacterium]
MDRAAPAPERRLPPLSARVCDRATLAFAGFTLCCHAVVAAGGSFRNLLWLLAAVTAAAIGVALWRRRRKAGVGAHEAAAIATPEPPASPSLSFRWRALGIGLGLGVLVVHARTGDVVHLWLGCVALLVFAGALLLFANPQPPPHVPAAASSRREAALWALALIAVVMTAMMQRADHDTPFYISLAVAAVDFPDRQLMLDPIHGIPGLKLHQPAHRIHTIELFSGLLAWFSQLSAFVAAQALTSSLAAALVPLAFARLFRELLPRLWLGAVVVVLVVLVSAAAPNWYGTFSFARIIHGKAVFLSVFLPLAWAYGLRFGRKPSGRRFALLCAVQIAAIGCTSSALWSVPMAAGLGVACTLRLDRNAPRVLAAALAASAYVVIVGLLLIGDMHETAATIEPSAYPGHRLRDAVAWTLLHGRLQTFGWAAILSAWALSRGLAQRYAVFVPLIVLLTVLNPFLEDEMRRFVTGPAYRRALWVLPLPVLMTLVLTAPRLFARRSAVGWLLVAIAGSAFVLVVPDFYGLGEENRVTFGVPRLKVQSRDYRAAARLTAAAPEGSAVVAPQRVAIWLPSFHHHPKIVYARENYLRRIRSVFGDEEAETRMRLSEAVSTGMDVERSTRESDGYERRQQLGMTEAFFLEKLRDFDVRAVSLSKTRPNAAFVREALERAEFAPVSTGRAFEEWRRNEPWGTAGAR